MLVNLELRQPNHEDIMNALNNLDEGVKMIYHEGQLAENCLNADNPHAKEYRKIRNLTAKLARQGKIELTQRLSSYRDKYNRRIFYYMARGLK